MNKKIVLIILLIVLIVIGIAGFVYYKYYSHYSGNAPAISEEELKAGFYYGFYDQKKPGTPDNWTWHEAGRSSGWSVPN